jgi:predicted nucleotide-binding protein
MARNVAPRPQRPNLTPQQLKAGIERLQTRTRELEQLEPDKLELYAPEVDALQASIDDTLSRIFGHETVEYSRYRETVDFAAEIPSFGEPRLLGQYHEDVRKGRTRIVTMLRQAVQSLQEELAEHDTTATIQTPSEPRRAPMSPPMSIERRRLVLAATSILKALGHAGFDRMLLELGVPEDVGTGSGLLARSTSLGRYVLTNPDAKAYDGTQLSEALIRRAQDLFNRGVMFNLIEPDRMEFEQAAQNAQAESNPVVPVTAATASGKNSKPAHLPSTRPKQRRKIFIVHGHDEGPREAVARFLERLHFEAVILHERANKGRTIIAKFQQEAADVGYAVVLMTPDDHGGKIGEHGKPRSRQNVVFELGFFIGALGPEKVAALVKGNVERPSDFDGVVYISVDDSGWRLKLGKELEAAGFTIDWAKVA